MSQRARPMSPDERRAALVEVTLPLLTRHGRQVTTRQIAEAAGVAEGTIFRVFDSKDDLVDAALRKAFLPGRLVEDIGAVPLGLPLRDRAIALVTLLQARFAEMFGLMRAVGLVSPPDQELESAEHARRVQQSLAAMIALLEPDEDELTVPVAEAVSRLRLLTFSGSHEEIAGGQMLTPEQIVDTVLYGLARRDQPGAGR